MEEQSSFLEWGGRCSFFSFLLKVSGMVIVLVYITGNNKIADEVEKLVGFYIILNEVKKLVYHMLLLDC
jgi:hypothetical protein